MSYYYVSVTSTEKLDHMYDFLTCNVSPWWQLLSENVPLNHPLTIALNEEESWAKNIASTPDTDMTLSIEARPRGHKDVGDSAPALISNVPGDRRRGSGYLSQCLMQFAALRVGTRRVLDSGYEIKEPLPFVRYHAHYDPAGRVLPIVLYSEKAEAYMRAREAGPDGSAWRLQHPLTFGTGYTHYPTDYVGMGRSKACMADTDAGRKIRASIAGYVAAEDVVKKELLRLAKLWRLVQA